MFGPWRSSSMCPMSFADILRNARSGPTTIVHKFLLSYDSNTDRVHAFVEGAPDLVFFRFFIERFTTPGSVRMYNCEGKANVYDAYQKITKRFPQCVRVMFFVDKDLDDITGQVWPNDPRVYVTDVYSIENYLCCKNVIERYIFEFVKLRRFSIDLGPMLEQFDEQLDKFRRAVTPVMGWILAVRRSGQRPVLANLDVGKFVMVSDSGVRRRKGAGRLKYLASSTGIEPPVSVLRQIRRGCEELRRLRPDQYIRGKFEGWFLVQFIKRFVEALSSVASTSGGSVSVVSQLENTNYVQLLVRGLEVPASLKVFLGFHLGASGSGPEPPKERRWSRPWLFFRSLFR